MDRDRQESRSMEPLQKSIVQNKMAQDSIWKVQWHESVATALTAEGEEPEHTEEHDH